MENSLLKNNSEKKVFSKKKKRIILKKIFFKRNNDINIIDKNKANIGPKKIKERNPGIDFVRILGMYAIIIHHLIVHGVLGFKYRNYAKQIELINIGTFWHVSSFALISGFIGYKTCKYSNLLYLWLCALFYSVGIHYLIRKYKPEFRLGIKFRCEFFPVIYYRYWYFSEYFGMYLFLPIINNGISILNKSQLKILVISTHFIFILLHYYINSTYDTFRMGNGRSVLWLLTFYLVGAYLGKYKIKYTGIKRIILCIICIFVYISSTLLCFNFTVDPSLFQKFFKNPKIILLFSRLFVMRLNSVPMILQAISITIFFTQIKYNKYIAKIITFIGPLTFGIYLIHDNVIIRDNVIHNIFIKVSNNLSLNAVIILLFFTGLKIFSICFIIDFIRHILFTILRIRKICIFIEKLMFKIF